jgi:Tfp pilus assembly protein PilN
LQLPWGKLLQSLEQTYPGHIALLSLEADERRNEATLTAEARNAEAMLAYLEVLKAPPGLKTVVLASHEIQEEDEQRPLRFVVRLGWRE